MGDGVGGTFVLDLGPHLVDVLLELSDGGVCEFVIRDEQFMSPFRNSQHFRELNAEALMDAQSSVPSQTGDGGVVLVAVCHAGGKEQVELPDTPGAVGLAEADFPCACI